MQHYALNVNELHDKWKSVFDCVLEIFESVLRQCTDGILIVLCLTRLSRIPLCLYLTHFLLQQWFVRSNFNIKWSFFIEKSINNYRLSPYYITSFVYYNLLNNLLTEYSRHEKFLYKHFHMLTVDILLIL